MFRFIAFEHLPVSALGKLYLTTAYGHTLGIGRGDATPEKAPCLHLYQDLSPINSLVVSNLEPYDFYDSVTLHPTKFIRFPALIFVELELDELPRTRKTARPTICRIPSFIICARP